jgi:S-adenosylmethionine hydrolase
VGTPRRACIAKTADGYFVVSPDNGSLTHLKAWVGIDEIREIDQTVNRLRGKGTEGVSVFHGRDLFGYCAARLASGIISYEQVGPQYPLDQIVTLPMHEPAVTGGRVRGIFEIGDPNFGNLWTNIPLELFTGAGFAYGDYLNLTVRHQGEVVFNQKALFHRSFGYARKGEVIIYNNEIMRVSVAISQGSLIERYHLDYGPDWEVEFEK